MNQMISSATLPASFLWAGGEDSHDEGEEGANLFAGLPGTVAGQLPRAMEFDAH